MTGIQHKILGAGLALLCLAAGTEVRANASFSGALDFSIDAPPAAVNLFGYGGPTSRFTPAYTETDGNAVAASSVGALRVGDISSVSGVSASGAAAPDGLAIAESTGALYYRLGNLSGSDPSLPPAQFYTAHFTMSYAYSLATAVDAVGINYAEAGVWLYPRAKLESATDWFTSPASSIIETITGTANATETRSVDFDLLLPANSITLLEIQFGIYGGAFSVDLPPLPPEVNELEPKLAVPEPASLALLSTALGMAGLTRRNRRRS